MSLHDAQDRRLDPDAFSGAVFDLDGVVTRTAAVHAAAWKEIFDAFLRQRAQRTGTPFRPFERDDYLRHVDGRPRYEGVATFLASRDIELDRGTPEDLPERDTVCGLGNRKNAAFHEILDRDGVEVFDSTTALIGRLRARGVRTALVSSSRNARRCSNAPAFPTSSTPSSMATIWRGSACAANPRPISSAQRPSGWASAGSGCRGRGCDLRGRGGARGGFGLIVGVDRGGRPADWQRRAPTWWWQTWAS